MFVTNMFKMVDKNDNGYISFREFLDFFVIFSRGEYSTDAVVSCAIYCMQLWCSSFIRSFLFAS